MSCFIMIAYNKRLGSYCWNRKNWYNFIRECEGSLNSSKDFCLNRGTTLNEEKWMDLLCKAPCLPNQNQSDPKSYQIFTLSDTGTTRTHKPPLVTSLGRFLILIAHPHPWAIPTTKQSYVYFAG
jgi:hypothetical protein